MSFEELQLIDEIKLFDELGVSCVGLQKEEGVICLTHERFFLNSFKVVVKFMQFRQ